MPVRFPSVLIRFAVAILALTAWQAQAQEMDIEGSFTDWSYLVYENPRSCAIVSRPVNSEAIRDGNAVSATRSEIRFFIMVKPGSPMIYEATFGAGYPLDQSKTVTIRIKDSTLALYPMEDIHPEFAWSRAQDDAGLIAAMRGGSEAIVTGLSTRGTTTIDTFSLMGFTAAIEKAEELCR